MTRKQKSSLDSSMSIAIGAAPTGEVNLNQEIRLIKPALLYGDTTTLISPKATMLSGILSMANLTDEQIVDFIGKLSPLLVHDSQRLQAAVKEYERVKRSKRKTLDDLRMVTLIEKEMRRVFNEEMIPMLEQLAVSSGAEQLAPAVQAGLLEIKPLGFNYVESPILGGLPDSSNTFSDAIMNDFIDELQIVMRRVHTYPLFDGSTSNLVTLAEREGLFARPAGTDSKAKQVHAAAAFMDRLPTFENATIQEILDIRDELSDPLVRFRSAISRISVQLDGGPHTDAFSAGVEQIFVNDIQPALLEIHERIKDNTSLERLAWNLPKELGWIAGGVLSAIVSQTLDFPQLAAGMPPVSISEALFVAGSATSLGKLATWAGAQVSEKHTESKAIGRMDLYFLYRTAHLLE